MKASGEQFHLSFAGSSAESTAIVTELAASLRVLVLDGVEVVQSYPENIVPPMGAGMVLVPWPNRIRDGRWVFREQVQQLDITEPARGNAIHGLLRNAGYCLVVHTESQVTLGATVFPQHGYPFLLDTSVDYSLGEDGLTVTHTIINESDEPAPVAVGAHPYLKVGETPVEELVLTINASTYYETDDRAIPTAELPLDGSELDLRRGQKVGELNLDCGFGGVIVRDGESVHSLTSPDGQRTELWADENFVCVQVFTPTSFPRENGKGRAVAVEPMTAPANAFNSGQGLRWLGPGETWSLQWGIRYKNPEQRQ